LKRKKKGKILAALSPHLTGGKEEREKGERIGEGGMGSFYKAHYPSNRKSGWGGGREEKRRERLKKELMTSPPF